MCDFSRINKLYGVEDDLHLKEQVSTLHIEYPVSKRNKLLNRENTTLKVAIPPEYLHCLEVNSTSGDIYIDEMHMQQIIAHSQSGDQTFTNIIAEQRLEANTTSGDLNIDHLQADSASFVTRSGDVTLVNERLKTNMVFTTSTGDVTLAFKQAPKSMKVDFQGASGKPFSRIDNFNFENVEKNHATGMTGTGTYKIDVTSKTGNLYLT